jgi:hypothetical protein
MIGTMIATIIEEQGHQAHTDHRQWVEDRLDTARDRRAEDSEAEEEVEGEVGMGIGRARTAGRGAGHHGGVSPGLLTAGLRPGHHRGGDTEDGIHRRGEVVAVAAAAVEAAVAAGEARATVRMAAGVRGNAVGAETGDENLGRERVLRSVVLAQDMF